MVRPLSYRGLGDRMTIYAVAGMYDKWSDGDIQPDIDPDHGYFTTLDEAQQYVDSLNTPLLARHSQLREGYEIKSYEWTKKNNEARKLGFRNPDFYPTDPGPFIPTFAVVVINPHEVTS